MYWTSSSELRSASSSLAGPKWDFTDPFWAAGVSTRCLHTWGTLWTPDTRRQLWPLHLLLSIRHAWFSFPSCICSSTFLARWFWLASLPYRPQSFLLIVRLAHCLPRPDSQSCLWISNRHVTPQGCPSHHSSSTISFGICQLSGDLEHWIDRVSCFLALSKSFQVQVCSYCFSPLRYEVDQCLIYRKFLFLR